MRDSPNVRESFQWLRGLEAVLRATANGSGAHGFRDRRILVPSRARARSRPLAGGRLPLQSGGPFSLNAARSNVSGTRSPSASSRFIVLRGLERVQLRSLSPCLVRPEGGLARSGARSTPRRLGAARDEPAHAHDRVRARPMFGSRSCSCSPRARVPARAPQAAARSRRVAQRDASHSRPVERGAHVLREAIVRIDRSLRRRRLREAPPRTQVIE